MLIPSATDASQPDGLRRALATADLPRSPGQPVFAEPWQAEAYAMVLAMIENGLFSWQEWSVSFGAVLAETGQANDGSRYYDHWLIALERIVLAKKLLQPLELDRRKHEWIAAYERTPHGQPVGL